MNRLNKLSKIFFVFALVALLIPAGIANAADSANSTASISFTDGALIWDDKTGTDLDNMELDFGSNELPTGEHIYPNKNADRTIVVSDSRNNSGDWNVTAKLSIFENTDQNKEFEGTITLARGACAHDKVTVESTIELVTGALLGSAVASAGSDAPRGVFEIEWATAEGITLGIDEENALGLVNVEYSATITWSLNVGP